MKKTLSILSLLLCSTLAIAQVKIADGITNGTVASAVSGSTVTLTATPADGYYLKDINAVKTADPSAAARTRAGSIDIPVLGAYELTKTSASADRSVEATFTLTLGEGLGAYVTATFEARTEIGAGDVTLSATAFTYNGSDQKPAVTLTGLTSGTGYTVAYDGTAWTDAGSYTLTVTGIDAWKGSVAKTWTIEPKEVGLSWSNVSMAYSGSAKTPTAKVTGTVNDDEIGVTVSGAQTNIGTYTATATALTGAKAANYKLPAANTCEFTISENAIEGIEVTGYTGTYDGAAHGISVTAPEGTTVKYGTTAGTYDLTASPTYTNVGTATVYYEVSQIGSASVTGSAQVAISQKTLTVVAADQTKVYGERDPALTCTVDGLVEGESLTGALTRKAGENVGTYAITQGTLAAGDNYSVAFTAATLTISQRKLTVTANAKTITYGDAPANDGVTYSGFAGTDDESSLDGTLAYDYSYVQYGQVGNSYTITPKGLTSTNYAITFVAGTQTVEPKEVSLSWSNVMLAYTGSPRLPTVKVTGMVNGDEIGVEVDGAQTDTGDYTATATALTGAKAGNYKLPAANTCAFTISDTAIEGIEVTGYTGTYDGAAHGISVTAPEGATVKYGTAAGTYDLTASPTYTDAGTATVYYEVSQANHTAFTGSAKVVISQKTLTVTADAKSKVVGEKDPALTYSVTGLVGSDALTGALTRAEGEDVGEYAITQGTLAASDNYTITFVAGTLTIKEDTSGGANGDANGDGLVNAADLVEMVNAMNGQASDKFILKNADMDGDKVITTADIDAVRKLIMSK